MRYILYVLIFYYMCLFVSYIEDLLFELKWHRVCRIFNLIGQIKKLESADMVFI